MSQFFDTTQENAILTLDEIIKVNTSSSVGDLPAMIFFVIPEPNTNVAHDGSPINVNITGYVHLEKLSKNVRAMIREELKVK